MIGIGSVAKIEAVPAYDGSRIPILHEKYASMGVAAPIAGL